MLFQRPAMCTKRSFSFVFISLVLFNFSVTSCFCGETYLTYSERSDADSPVLKLNRARREVIESDESQRNLRLFDAGTEFNYTNLTFEKEESARVVKSSENEGPQMKVSVISDWFLPELRVCNELQAELGKSTSNFTECAIMNARPINICLQCIAPYNDTIHTYQQLMEASEKSVKCKDVLFGKDKLEIVENMYENVVNLWDQGNCYSCYENEGGSPDLFIVSNLTLNFFKASHEVTECFEHIKFYNERENDNSNNTCSRCRTMYEHLGAIYDLIVKDLINNQPTEEVCADIADAMNVTHHLWNNQFKCKVFDTDIGYAVFVLTGSLSSVPILFYLAAKVLSNAETILLVLPKRKSFIQDSTQLQM